MKKFWAVLLSAILAMALIPAGTLAAATPSPTLALAEDTGVSNDNITSNGQMNVGSLEPGAAWEYSTDGASSWSTGSGVSFELEDGTYGAGTIQARQTVGGSTSAPAANADTIVVAKNQIANGDFQQGNTGFSSDYAYTAVPTCDETEYSVVAMSRAVHDAWTTAYDNTLGTADGLYFVANGSLDNSDMVWQSTSAITVNANDPYRFEAYLMSLVSDSIGYPRVRFQLGDGTNWVDMGTTNVSWAPGEVGIWHVIYADGKFSNAGTYYIRLMNDQTSQFNDLGVDDVYFGLRIAAPSVSDDDLPLPDPPVFDTSSMLSLELEADTGYDTGDGLTSNGQINVNGLQYAWQYSTNGGSSWTGGTGSSFTLTGDGAKSVIVRQRNAGDTAWEAASAPLEFTLDTTAPTLDTATVNSNTLTLTYDENLDSHRPPVVGDFSVSVNGAGAQAPSSVHVSGKMVVLTLADSVYDGQSVTVQYTVPGGIQAVQDCAGNKAAGLASQAVVNNTVTVTYQANGATSGTAPAAQNKASGVDLVLAANSGNLERTGYDFAGWNTQADGKGTDYAEGASYSVDVSADLYAKWIDNTHTITYDANGGTGSASEKHTGGDTAVLHSGEGFTRSGYVISGWNIGGTEHALGALYTMPRNDVAAKAVWAADSDGDGTSDADEDAAGTDPDDENDTPPKGTIRVQVYHADQSPAAGLTAVLNSQPITAVTDADGSVVFEDVSLSPHTLTLRSGTVQLGTYSLRFESGAENASVITDNAATDSNGSVRTTVASGFLSLDITIRQNADEQWQLGDAETAEQVANPNTGSGAANLWWLWACIPAVLIAASIASVKRRAKQS